MVSDITGIDYKILKDNVVLETNELPISTKNEKAKRCDFVLRITDNKIINLELNAHRYSGLVIKNLSYLFQLFASTFKKGNEYDSDLIVMQININCYNDNYSKALSKYHLLEDDTHKLYVKNIAIYDLNIVKCHELYYNLREKEEDIPNYIRWGAFIYNNSFNEIPNIVSNIITDKERNKIMSKLSKLTHDDLFYTKEEALEWAEWEWRSIRTEARNEGLAEGRSEGIEQGIEQGIKQNTENTIKNMLKKKFSLEDIADITGKSIDEIKKYL